MEESPDNSENARRTVINLVEEIVQLHSRLLKPEDYFREFLTRVLKAIAAPAGAAYLLDSDNNLCLVSQINLSVTELAIESHDKEHTELLGVALKWARPLMLLPYEQIKPPGTQTNPAINPTDLFLFFAPIEIDGKIAGLVEVFQDHDRDPAAQKGYFQFVTKMAEGASLYARIQKG